MLTHVTARVIVNLTYCKSEKNIRSKMKGWFYYSVWGIILPGWNEHVFS